MRPTRLMGAVVIAALAGGAAYAAARDGVSVPAPVTSDAMPISTPTSQLRQVPDTTAWLEPPLPSTAPAPSQDPLGVLSEGLAAWGRFAVTGDLDTVSPWFWGEGPQWERFELEALELSADPLGDPPYEVLVKESDVSGDGEETRVEARVTFIRTGEPSQTFRWRIVLRSENNRWRIWTVEEADSYPSSSSIEKP